MTPTPDCGHDDPKGLSFFPGSGEPVFFDKEGKSICIDCFERFKRDYYYTKIGDTTFGLGTENAQNISTVWLGIDHDIPGWSMFRDKAVVAYRPLIFETMVFGGPYADYQTRYRTEKAARQGHALVVGAIKAGRNPEWLEL